MVGREAILSLLHTFLSPPTKREAFPRSKIPLRQPGSHDIVGAGGVAVQINAMTHVGLNVDLDAGAGGEAGDGAALGAHEVITTVALAEDQVVLGRDVQHRSRERGGGEVEGGLAQELTGGEGELGGLGVLQHGRVEVRVGEEGELVGVLIGPGQVARGPAGEAGRLVLRRKPEGGVGDEEGLVGEVVAVARQHQRIRELWRHRRQRVAQFTAPTVSHVHHFRRDRDLGDLALPHRPRQLGQHRQLHGRLDHVVRVHFGGLAAPQSVPGQGAVARAQRRVDVTVLRVAGIAGQAEVPVRFVEAEAMGEELQRFGFGGLLVRRAVLDADLEGLRHFRRVNMYRYRRGVTHDHRVGKSHRAITVGELREGKFDARNVVHFDWHEEGLAFVWWC